MISHEASLPIFLGAGFFEVATELVAHRREQFVGEFGLAAGAEPFVKRRRQDMGRHGFIDGGLDGPAPFAGIRDPAAEVCQGGSLSKAIACRSSSHEATTLPRRHNSAMSRRLKSYW